MIQRPIRIRRGRRTDFVAVMELLAASGLPVPAPDRPVLRRFRRLVADLGCDFYLATVDGRVVGLAHVTYARQLTGGPLATVAALLVADWSRRRGVGTALLQFALSRARRRACVGLRCLASNGDAACESGLLRRVGARRSGTLFEVPLVPEG